MTSLYRDFAPQTDPVKGKTVLITGGTGSFGRKMVHTLLTHFDPKKVIIFSRDELKQYEMRGEMEEVHTQDKLAKLRFFLGDVRDRNRLELARHRYRHPRGRLETGACRRI
jgi:UDP-N-acetylglucosamine 4,6-dehydratase/5-epimerase